MANFTVNKKELVSVTAAALTAMQERATAKVLEFVYTKAGKKNAYSDVNDLCKDKALVAELKKIFVHDLQNLDMQLEIIILFFILMNLKTNL